MQPSPDELRKRLMETIAWCGAKAIEDPKISLRTLHMDSGPLSEMKSPIERQTLVDAVCGNRSMLLRPFLHGKQGRGPAGGRLLSYAPDEELFDGAAESVSNGFFDEHNAPPWDTWICYLPAGVLIAWVPPTCLELVQAGIDVNPEQCIRWADQDLAVGDLAALGLGDS